MSASDAGDAKWTMRNVGRDVVKLQYVGRLARASKTRRTRGQQRGDFLSEMHGSTAKGYAGRESVCFCTVGMCTKGRTSGPCSSSYACKSLPVKGIKPFHIHVYTGHRFYVCCLRAALSSSGVQQPMSTGLGHISMTVHARCVDGTAIKRLYNSNVRAI